MLVEVPSCDRNCQGYAGCHDRGDKENFILKNAFNLVWGIGFVWMKMNKRPNTFQPIYAKMKSLNLSVAHMHDYQSHWTALPQTICWIIELSLCLSMEKRRKEGRRVCDIYIYIYIERERERGAKIGVLPGVSPSGTWLLALKCTEKNYIPLLWWGWGSEVSGSCYSSWVSEVCCKLRWGRKTKVWNGIYGGSCNSTSALAERVWPLQSKRMGLP